MADVSADVLVVVPKSDELFALEETLKASGVVARPDRAIDGAPVTRAEIGGYEVVVVVANQGMKAAQRVTSGAIEAFQPAVALLVGTAFGNERRVGIFDVVIGGDSIDLSEMVVDQEKGPLPRADLYHTAESIKQDAERFVHETFPGGHLGDYLRTSLPAHRATLEAVESERESPFRVSIGYIASTPMLVKSSEFQEIIWRHDDRIHCCDMEAGGFVDAAKQTGIPWLVIRGISDLGTAQTKKELYRVPAASAAAGVAMKFIERGLKLTDPRKRLLEESSDQKLTTSQFFAGHSPVEYFKSRILSTDGLTLSSLDKSTTPSARDLVAVCMAEGLSRSRARERVGAIQAEYFAEKYLDYTYDQGNLRGAIPDWFDEVRDSVKNTGVQLADSLVLDVGIGNGLEAPAFIGSCRELWAADISQPLLDRLSVKYPELRTICAPAERMKDVETGSVDLYVSLRTYMSSFFDVEASLREALRVTRRGGGIVISVANGYVDSVEGKAEIVRGLLVPGSDTAVDREAPRRHAERIVVGLERLGFEGVGMLANRTDIYIWARRRTAR